ncbi:MAG: hypothetical protein ABIK99_03245 [candidate division WOR-3 bacterium]
MNLNRRKLPLLCLFFSLLSGAEIKAGKMAIIQGKEGRVTHFSEGVTIRDGKTVISAQTGFYHPHQNLFLLLDSVTIKSEEGELRGESIFYSLNTKMAEVKKNVRLDFPSLKILTEHLYWDGEKREAKSGEVFLILKEKEVEIKGYDAVYHSPSKKGSSKRPILFLKGKETTEVVAQELIYDGEREKVIFTPDVAVRQKNSTFFTDTLIYFVTGDSGIALGHSHLIGENEEVRGKEFRFFVEGGALKLVKAFGEVSLVYETKGERVEIGGETFSAQIANGEISEMTIENIAYGRVVMK